MADEIDNGTSATAVAEPPAPREGDAPETPPNISQERQDDGPGETEADYEAEDDAILARLNVPTRRGAAPADTAGASATDAKGRENTPQPQGQPDQAAGAPNLSREDAELLSRFRFSPKHLPADQAERNAFISNLRERHTAMGRMWRELEDLRKGKNSSPANTSPANDGGEAPAQTQQTTAAGNDPQTRQWLADLLGGEDQADRLMQILEQRVEARLAPTAQALQQAEQRAARSERILQAQHTQEGLADAAKLLGDVVPLDESPAGLQNRARIFEQAQQLFNANFDPENPAKFNVRHAIARAAGLVFQNEITLAQRKALAKDQGRVLRGSPDRGGLTNSSKQALTEEQRDDLYLRAIRRGDSPEDARALAYGR